MRLATYEDFESEDGLYWPAYTDYSFFRTRAERLAREHAEKRILVAGCGWGYTIKHGRELGLDIWGVDASPYALTKARELGLYREVMYGDITTAANMPELEVDLVLTEDVYPMLTLDEVERAQEVLHRYGVVKHWITPAPAQVHPAIQCALLPTEWEQLLAPDEVWLVGHGH